jgi:hypothetical protein
MNLSYLVAEGMKEHAHVIEGLDVTEAKVVPGVNGGRRQDLVGSVKSRLSLEQRACLQGDRVLTEANAPLRERVAE